MAKEKEYIRVTAVRGKIHKIVEGTHVCITQADFDKNPEQVYKLPMCQMSMDLILKQKLFKLVKTEDVSAIQDLISQATNG